MQQNFLKIRIYMHGVFYNKDVSVIYIGQDGELGFCKGYFHDSWSILMLNYIILYHNCCMWLKTTMYNNSYVSGNKLYNNLCIVDDDDFGIQIVDQSGRPLQMWL